MCIRDRPEIHVRLVSPLAPHPLDLHGYSRYDTTVPRRPPARRCWGGIMSSDSNRRKFLGTAAGAAAFTILPRHLLARSGEVPPSDKITLAYICLLYTSDAADDLT